MANREHKDILAKDMEWRDGSNEGTKYARFELNPDTKEAPTVILTKFQPETVVAPHRHECNYLEYVIEGDQTIGRTTFRAGDVRIVRGGAGYGPIKMGKDGCTVLIVFEDGSRSKWEALR